MHMQSRVILNLGNQLFEGSGRKTIAFIDVKIDVCRFDLCPEILFDQRTFGVLLEDHELTWCGRVARSLNALLEIGEADVQLDSMELQTYNRKRVTRSLCEPEWKWDVKSTVVAAVVDQVRNVMLFPDHFP